MTNSLAEQKNDRFRFRVWHKKFNKWIDIGFLRNGQGKLYVDYNATDEQEDCIIEQCTGLRDKNGKLIYEGDLVKHKSWDEIEKVIWDYTQIGFCFDNGAGTHRASDFEFILSEFEIIGNIHETPELLEEIKSDWN
jgi:uncharacterized phage protein (TIGR01671 family)